MSLNMSQPVKVKLAVVVLRATLKPAPHIHCSPLERPPPLGVGVGVGVGVVVGV